MEEIIDLVDNGLFPDEADQELVRNFDCSCPPEIRHASAFKTISERLYLTQEVLRHRLIATSDLSREDRKMANVHDAVLELQLMNPEERIQLLLRKEELTKIKQEEEARLKNLSESGRKQTRNQRTSAAASLSLKSFNFHHHHKRRRGGRRKGRFLRKIFRNTSTNMSTSALIARFHIKKCSIRLIRMPEKFIDEHTTSTSCTMQSKYECVPEKIQPQNNETPVDVPIVSVTEQLNENSVFAQDSERTMTPNEDKRCHNDNKKEVQKPKIQEFSIFDCPQPPKKRHVRPATYDEEYRRKIKVTEDKKIQNITLNSNAAAINPQYSMIPENKTKGVSERLRYYERKSKLYPKYLEWQFSSDEEEHRMSANQKKRKRRKKYNRRGSRSDSSGKLQKKGNVANTPGQLEPGNKSLNDSFSIPELEKFNYPERTRKSYECYWNQFTMNQQHSKESHCSNNGILINPAQNENSIRESHIMNNPKSNGDIVQTPTIHPPLRNKYFTCRPSDAYIAAGNTSTNTSFAEEPNALPILDFSSEVTTSNLISDAINYDEFHNEINSYTEDNRVDYILPHSTHEIEHLNKETGTEFTADILLNYNHLGIHSQFIENETFNEESGFGMIV